MKIKVVIFDLDGTIGDTLPLCVQAFRLSIEPLLGASLSDADIINTFGPSEEGSVRTLIPERVEEGLAGYLAYYQKLHDCCPTAFDGVLDLLLELKRRGVGLAMVTGKGPKSTEITLERFGLSGLFEVVETGKPEGPSKPEGLRAVMARYPAVTIDEMLYVGDAPSDVSACRSVGLRIAGAAWASTASKERLLAMQADWVFERVEDFGEWVLGHSLSLVNEKNV
ncbi:MAG: HAD family hydrolase [Bacteroidales bacterium]